MVHNTEELEVEPLYAYELISSVTVPSSNQIVIRPHPTLILDDDKLRRVVFASNAVSQKRDNGCVPVSRQWKPPRDLEFIVYDNQRSTCSILQRFNGSCLYAVQVDIAQNMDASSAYADHIGDWCRLNVHLHTYCTQHDFTSNV